MLSPSIYWISQIGNRKIALAARPRGGEDLDYEMSGWRNAGVDLVVSLLEPSEVRELELSDEEASCNRNNISFRSFSMPDRGVPENRKNFNSLITSLADEVESGKSVLIHCRAGIGRTGLVACCLLQSVGVKADEAFSLLTVARGVSVPDTLEQRKYAESFLL